MRSWTAALFRPIDIAWLVVARVLIGSSLALEVAGSLALGYIREYTEPAFHFSYLFFTWLPALPPVGMIGLHLLIIGLGVAVAAGWRFQFTAPALCLAFTWLFLAEQTRYINHFYLYSLLAGLLALTPAHRAASADVRAGRTTASTTTPAWTRWLLQLQLGLVYFFAGLAKLNPDWWAGASLRIWLAPKAHYFLIGPLLAQPWLPVWMSRAGLAFDLLLVPLLLWRRTRLLALVAAAFFHLSNVLVFGLGTFPWFSLGLTVCLFLPPNWPRQTPKLRSWLAARVPLPALSAKPIIPRTAPVLLTFLAFYIAVQLLVPLRYLLYPGDVHWTEEGHQFAWHMMLRSKTGSVYYHVRHSNGQLDIVDPLRYLTPRQQHYLLSNPDALLQFAHFLARDYQQRGLGPVAVHAISLVRLNGRAPRPLVSPDVNMAALPRQVAPYKWISE
ncbi:HTTM domain-containing protein [Hymenobacter sp. NBH84]|uniref:HTTM domain-containing protein n=1 Tax=Hymenobacter sp. NBH84 TaxID=2596915 RepID=UPI001627F3C6|nr:HTTM domain-containing protein [Hymenobacter sp. NBH84]QNE40572.1 HTTM domain-containing protein [Hymenobacter sp. NBH84]